MTERACTGSHATGFDHTGFVARIAKPHFGKFDLVRKNTQRGAHELSAFVSQVDCFAEGAQLLKHGHKFSDCKKKECTRMEFDRSLQRRKQKRCFRTNVAKGRQARARHDHLWWSRSSTRTTRWPVSKSVADQDLSEKRLHLRSSCSHERCAIRRATTTDLHHSQWACSSSVSADVSLGSLPLTHSTPSCSSCLWTRVLDRLHRQRSEVVMNFFDKTPRCVGQSDTVLRVTWPRR